MVIRSSSGLFAAGKRAKRGVHWPVVTGKQGHTQARFPKEVCMDDKAGGVGNLNCNFCGFIVVLFIVCPRST